MTYELIVLIVLFFICIKYGIPAAKCLFKIKKEQREVDCAIGYEAINNMIKNVNSEDDVEAVYLASEEWKDFYSGRVDQGLLLKRYDYLRKSYMQLLRVDFSRK